MMKKNKTVKRVGKKAAMSAFFFAAAMGLALGGADNIQAQTSLTVTGSLAGDAGDKAGGGGGGGIGAGGSGGQGGGGVGVGGTVAGNGSSGSVTSGAGGSGGQGGSAGTSPAVRAAAPVHPEVEPQLAAALPVG